MEQTLACKQWLLAADCRFDITLLDYQSERPNTLTAASLPRRLRSTARTLLRNVSLLSEALTFRVVCLSLGTRYSAMFGSQNVLIHGDEDLPHTVLPPLARIARRARHSCKANDEHCKCKQMRRAAEKVLASLRTEPRLVRVAATLGWSFPRRASAISSELHRSFSLPYD